MHLQIPHMALAEDSDVDVDDWFCAEALPWEENWDDLNLGFESIEPLSMVERMPTEKELLALEAQPEDFPQACEDEALATDDC